MPWLLARDPLSGREFAQLLEWCGPAAAAADDADQSGQRGFCCSSFAVHSMSSQHSTHTARKSQMGSTTNNKHPVKDAASCSLGPETRVPRMLSSASPSGGQAATRKQTQATPKRLLEIAPQFGRIRRRCQAGNLVKSSARRRAGATANDLYLLRRARLSVRNKDTDWQHGRRTTIRHCMESVQLIRAVQCEITAGGSGSCASRITQSMTQRNPRALPFRESRHRPIV